MDNGKLKMENGKWKIENLTIVSEIVVEGIFVGIPVVEGAKVFVAVSLGFEFVAAEVFLVIKQEIEVNCAHNTHLRFRE